MEGAGELANHFFIICVRRWAMTAAAVACAGWAWGPGSRLEEGVGEKFQGLAGLKAHVDVAFSALGVAGWSARSTRLSCFC